MKLIFILFLLQLHNSNARVNVRQDLRPRDLEVEAIEAAILQGLLEEEEALPAEWVNIGLDICVYQNYIRSQLALNGLGGLNAANMNLLLYDLDLMREARRIVRQDPHFQTPQHRSQGVLLYKSSHRHSIDDLFLSRHLWMRKFEQVHNIRGDWSPEFYTLHMFDVASDAFQMIWATATKMGCYGRLRDDGTLVVCKYDTVPRVGGMVFEVGEACSRCQDGFVCDVRRGLCYRESDFE